MNKLLILVLLTFGLMTSGYAMNNGGENNGSNHHNNYNNNNSKTYNKANARANARSNATAKQGQLQGQVQGQGQSQSGTVANEITDNSIDIEEYPVSSAASISAGLCSSGASTQSKNLGLSVGVSSAFCQYLEMARLFIEIGDTARANEAVTLAWKTAKRDGVYDKIRSLLTLGIL